MLSSVGFICLLPMHVANELYSKSNIIRIGAFLFLFLFLFSFLVTFHRIEPEGKFLIATKKTVKPPPKVLHAK